MTDKLPHHEHYLRGHKEAEDLSKLSDKLAPLEETAAKSESDIESRDDDGALFIDTGKLKLPQGFVENEQEKRGIFGLEPVIVVILTLMLVFIAFIAYLVYLTPVPNK
jgi:hypothetical protein